MSNSSPTQPNIVLIVMDTARADVFMELHRTDSIPFFADIDAKSTQFTSAFASAPWTLPSHASLFTGSFPSKHGGHAGHKKLHDSYTTLPEVFSNENYETVAVSNNTWINEEFGFGQGFDKFYKNWQYIQSKTDFGTIARQEEGNGKFRKIAERIFEGNPLTNLFNALYGRFYRKTHDDGAARTNQWISNWLTSRNNSRQFFLFINYLEPHLEYRPPREHATEFLPDSVSYEEAMNVNQDAWTYIADSVQMSEADFDVLRALYRAEITYLDERIGELQEQLEAAGEWNDTIFVVTGDHGENIGDHALMDHQYCLYDTLIHVPLVIAGGAFDGGGTVDDLVQLTDLGPTLLDAAGIEAPEFREQAQGQSFYPEAENEAREYVFAEYLAPQPSMEALEKRVGTLPDDIRRFDRSLRAVRSQEWKLIRGSDESTELYNVADDPGESTDLSEVYPERAEALSTNLNEWLDSFEHADIDGNVAMTDETANRLEDLGYLQ